MSEVEFAGGKASSSRVPPLHLIPTLCLEKTAERFRLGIERKGEKSWNAISDNQEVLTDLDFLLERTSHIVHHALRLRDKVITYRADPAAGLRLLAEDDDASAIVWGGMFLQCAVEALRDAQDVRPCVPSDETVQEPGEAAGASVQTGRGPDDVYWIGKPSDPAVEAAAAAGCDTAEEEWVSGTVAARTCGMTPEQVGWAVVKEMVSYQVFEGFLHVRLSDVRQLAERLRGRGHDTAVL